MKHESIISRIVSAIKGNKVAVRENLFYDTVKGLGSFALDDLINLRAATALLSGVNQTVITAGTTVTPKVIAYNTTATPSYTLINTNTYPVTVNANAAIGAVTIAINALPITIPPGTQLILNTGVGQATVVTTALAIAGAVTLSVVALTVAITASAVYKAIANLIDTLTNVQYDGVNFTIIGADDGTGHFADSYTFNIKP